MDNVIYKHETFQIVGAAIDVHNHLGAGYLEAVYHEALQMEFNLREIPYQSQKPIQIQYKGNPLAKEYIADFVCFKSIIVEIKAIEKLGGREEAQIINYLKATDYPLGILINFGKFPKFEWKRYANTK